MKEFLKRMGRCVVLAAAVSSMSVATTSVLMAVLVTILWVYFLKDYQWTPRIKATTGATTGTKGDAPPNTVLFQLHEAVVMRQLILPGDLSTTWADIGGCDDVLRHLKEQVIFPFSYACSHKPDALLMPPKGVLLYGPPGCGKTLIAKAMAKEIQTNFLNIDVSTIKNMWVGETEKMAAAIFTVAYKLQPCIIFLDEVDNLLGTRNSLEGTASAGLKSTFLQMWDGLESDSTARVMVLAATNRLDAVDTAFLRRLPLQFEINLPSAEGRLAILSIQLRQVPLAEDVSLHNLVQMTDGFSGSDLQELCRCAATRRLVDYMDQVSGCADSYQNGLRDLTNEDFMIALDMHRLKAGEESSLHRFYI